MQFNSARAIEQICWNLRLSDYPRSLNRSRVDSLANGAPPYTPDEAARNGVEVNVNDLSLTRLAHEARLQLSQAFNKPGSFFTARTDMGTSSRRQSYGSVVTKEVNRIMKSSECYFECMRSKFGLQVMHGIGPSNWQDPDRWCGIELGVEDVLMPTNTRLTFRNLPFFAVWRGYTAAELIKLTRHPERNPGWNMPVVKRALDWVDQQTAKLYGGSTWAEYWSPEKRVDRQKQDSGIYASSLCPTIDCYDFYYWDDSRKHEGWRRRIIFDAWGGSAAWAGSSGYGTKNVMPSKNLLDDTGLFLFSSGDRVVADDIHQILHFQFADLSAKAPFTYHGIRSLGFLLYAVCHLQNRLRCAFSEAVFENLLMYLRVKSLDEAERVLKIEFANRGIIDESVQILPPNERWQPNAQLAELGLNEFKQTISDNSSSYVQNQNLSRDRVEKTKFQVMAEVNAMQTLVSAGLQQDYRYQTTEYREIFRRFMKKNSLDPDVRDFRARVLARGVPEKLLVPEAWDIEPERIMGSGNKTLEMAIAQQLMEWRSAYAPEAQQTILRTATLAITDDASMTEELVPDSPSVSNDAQAAMFAFGTLMHGGEAKFTKGQNLLEVTTILIGELALAVQQTMRTGGVPTPDRLMGMQNVITHVSELVGGVAQDPTQKGKAKQLAKVSGQLANQIKAFGQRLQQQQQAQSQNGNGDGGAEAKGKIMEGIISAQAKAQNARESHAMRTAQKQASWESEEQRKQADHQLETKRKLLDVQVDTAAKDIETAATVKREAAKADAAPEKTE